MNVDLYIMFVYAETQLSREDEEGEQIKRLVSGTLSLHFSGKHVALHFIRDGLYLKIIFLKTGRVIN